MNYQVPTEEFAHLLKGLRSGCPPHGGIALGKLKLTLESLYVP